MRRPEWRDDLVAEVREQVALAAHLLRWVVLGAASGAMAGLASFVFLEALDRITDTRIEHDWLLWLLPLAGLATGAAYHYVGGRAGEGNALLLEQIHEPTAWVPRRMAPLVLVGTLVSHLFGASVGREGTALQMSGSLTDGLARILRLRPADRSLLLVAALAGGFSSVFGVPLAGTVFALEVQSIGRIRYEALVPALTAAVVGDLVVTGLGHPHELPSPLDIPLDGVLLLKVGLAGLLFGLTSTAFSIVTHAIRGVASRIAWPPARPVLGGVATIALVLLVGRDYLGLSLPLIGEALGGGDIGGWAFALKLLFTAIALGCGFPGGEVTPLFVIGATLGAALATPLGVDGAMLAGVGFVAVFAGAANTPLACTIMGAELFGSGALVPFAVGCVVSYIFSSHQGIYPTQRIHVGKGPGSVEGRPTVAEWARRRRA